MVTSLLYGLRSIERVLALTLLTVLFVLVALSSISRYVGYPLIWSIELTQALFVWLCVLAGDLTLQRYGHFSIDMLAGLLPRRARLVLDLADFALVGALLALLAYHGFNFAQMTGMRPLPILGVTSAAATAALPIGFVLMLITTIEQAIGRVRGRHVAAEAGPREVM